MSIEQRLAEIEDRLEIGQLPIRYALAVDARDIDEWVALSVPDVDCGPAGRGRDVLRASITPLVTTFYRSVHLICGHRVELLGPDSARGKTYCRAEHEVGDRWVVMAICYEDDYAKVDGRWHFARRTERHWYAVDQLGRPQEAPGFTDWHPERPPALPHRWPTWSTFWEAVELSDITGAP